MILLSKKKWMLCVERSSPNAMFFYVAQELPEGTVKLFWLCSCSTQIEFLSVQQLSPGDVICLFGPAANISTNQSSAVIVTWQRSAHLRQ